MTDRKPDRRDGDGLLSPREYLKLKYMGDCKCGDCQLVPARVLATWAELFDRLPTRDDEEGAGLADEIKAADALPSEASFDNAPDMLRWLNDEAAPPKSASDAMREALEPFARLFEKFEDGRMARGDNWPADHVEFNARPRTDKESVGYKFGDLRRAHAAFSSAPAPPAEDQCKRRAWEDYCDICGNVSIGPCKRDTYFTSPAVATESIGGREPSPAMRIAGGIAFIEASKTAKTLVDCADACWKAMWDAK